MKNEAPKFKLIQGGKKDPKIKFNKELFFVFIIIIAYIWSTLYVN